MAHLCRDCPNHGSGGGNQRRADRFEPVDGDIERQHRFGQRARRCSCHAGLEQLLPDRGRADAYQRRLWKRERNDRSIGTHHEPVRRRNRLRGLRCRPVDLDLCRIERWDDGLLLSQQDSIDDAELHGGLRAVHVPSGPGKVQRQPNLRG